MENPSTNYLFLLGGHDLEMLEIKELLDKNNEKYLDNNLTWGAQWSDYSTDIEKPENKGKIFVGIELSQKQDMPLDGIDIDHHNFNSDKVSSIEQVSKLLNVELNHWQELVAANDRGYIPGLEQMCATEKEIKKIREADKKAQGVTEVDEKKAKESVEKHKEEIDDFVIIKSLTEKFSTITDLMYGKTNKLIVYNDTSLSYYGPIPKELISHYKNQIETNKAYYGGDNKNGFFGLAKEHWNKNEIEKEKQKIIDIIKKTPSEKIFSYHVFLFPFSWKNWDSKDDSTLKENFNLGKFRDNLLNNDQCKWKRESFELNHFDHYNEYNYFYEYVREILYDLEDNLRTTKTKKNDQIINHFEYNLPEKGKLFYNIKLKENGYIYHLEIDSILLNIYSTGTAVLSFHLRNHLYHNQNYILKINKFGRRLFVPFFDLKPDSIYSGNNDDTNEKLLLCSTKNYEIPDAIWIGQKEMPDKGDKYFEDFSKYLKKETFKHGPFVLPRFITGLFPDDFFKTHEKTGRKVNNSQQNSNAKFKVYLRPVLDDRMFVVSWYGNSQLAADMSKVSDCTDLVIAGNEISDNRNKKTYYSYETNDWWYNYIYVDTSPMQTNKFQKQELLKSQTYSRWVGQKTLYGMSRYSLVMLTSDFSDTPSYLVRHLQSMYYKMAELCLLQRATILSFSGEITDVADLINKNDENHSEDKKEKKKDNKEKQKDKIVTDRIEGLYKHYLLFVNKIYFREITAQEQGIEMYDIMQNTMRIPQEVKGLDYEIDELNRFSAMLHDKAEQKDMKGLTGKANKLAQIAAIFLVPTLIIGLLTMKSMPDYIDIPKFLFGGTLAWPFLVSFGIIVIFSCIGYWLIMKFILHDANSNDKSNFFLSCIGYRLFKRFILHNTHSDDKSNIKNQGNHE